MKTRTTITLIVIIITGAIILDNQRTKQTTPYNIPSSYETATFAGGCFWCMEAAFEAVEGVVESISGYTGGTTVNPTYEQVSRGNTKHLEAVQLYYDPKEVSYQSLVEVFWRSIDPTDPGGQFVDRGSQYGTAIFYHNDDQKRIAKESKENLETSNRFSKPIVTPILEFTIFYPAEEYHQDYYKKNVLNYKTYSKLSGREEFIERNWSE